MTDPIEAKVDICFGSPNINSWRTFGFDDSSGVICYSAVLPDVTADQDFWKRLEDADNIID